MTNEEIANRLDEAGELIKTHGWWNGTGIPDLCFCAVTAISRVCRVGLSISLDYYPVLKALRIDLSEVSIADWNDKQPNGQAVIAALHGAATRLRTQVTISDFSS